MIHVDLLPMAKTVLGVVKLIILIDCTEARAERSQEMTTKKNAEQFIMCQVAEETEMATQEFDMVRSRIFSFYSVKLILMVKLKSKI